MLQTDAQIVAGDSGGPLVSTADKVIGMDTAASAGSFGNQASDLGFAIPINRALSIANQIRNGQASSTITIGASGFLGVMVPSKQASAPTSPAQQRQLEIAVQGGSASPAITSCVATGLNYSGVPQTIAPVEKGTLVLGTLCNTPVALTGIIAGDVITAVDGHTVGSPDSLTSILLHYPAGTTVSVAWVDTSGQQHVSGVRLIQHPPT